jgi:hypothetical protein
MHVAANYQVALELADARHDSVARGSGVAPVAVCWKGDNGARSVR